MASADLGRPPLLRMWVAHLAEVIAMGATVRLSGHRRHFKTVFLRGSSLEGCWLLIARVDGFQVFTPAFMLPCFHTSPSDMKVVFRRFA